VRWTAVCAAVVLGVLVSAGCEHLQNLASAPRWMVLSCVLEMRSSGERPFPNLGPACNRLSMWLHEHGADRGSEGGV